MRGALGEIAAVALTLTLALSDVVSVDDGVARAAVPLAAPLKVAKRGDGVVAPDALADVQSVPEPAAERVSDGSLVEEADAGGLRLVDTLPDGEGELEGEKGGVAVAELDDDVDTEVVALAALLAVAEGVARALIVDVSEARAEPDAVAVALRSALGERSEVADWMPVALVQALPAPLPDGDAEPVALAVAAAAVADTVRQAAGVDVASSPLGETLGVCDALCSGDPEA